MTQKSSSTQGQSRTTTGGTQGGAEAGHSTTREMTDKAKETAGQVVEQAGQQVSSRIAVQKDRAAQGLGTMAHALRQTGDQLRDQDQIGMTDYINRAASQVERLGDYLRQKEVRELVDDVERYARRQPALFLGGAFLAGLLAARFLKSSREQIEPARYYEGSRGTDYPRGAMTYETNYERAVGGTTTTYNPTTRTQGGTGTEDM